MVAIAGAKGIPPGVANLRRRRTAQRVVIEIAAVKKRNKRKA
jgi:hypothetical protein